MIIKTAHQTRDKKRRLITFKELGIYFQLSRPTIYKRIKEYGKPLDLHDVFSILDFSFWMWGNL